MQSILSDTNPTNGSNSPGVNSYILRNKVLPILSDNIFNIRESIPYDRLNLPKLSHPKLIKQKGVIQLFIAEIPKLLSLLLFKVLISILFLTSSLSCHAWILFIVSTIECVPDSPIAQSVERRTVNPQVPGSSPGWRAKILKTHSLSGFFLIYLFAYLFIKKLFVFDSSQITFFIIGCIASLALLTIFLQQSYRPKQKFYAKRVITRYETKMFHRLKDAFPEHHVMAQVAFSALITN